MRARSLDVAAAGRRQGFSMHTRKEMIRATTQSKGDMFLELTLAIEGFGARATLDVDAEHVDEGHFFLASYQEARRKETEQMRFSANSFRPKRTKLC